MIDELGTIMLVTAAVSELTDYNQVLSYVDAGNEVVLTRNGNACYTIVSMDEWNSIKAMLRFMKDMQAVDDEMQCGGQAFTEGELLASLGIND